MKAICLYNRTPIMPEALAAVGWKVWSFDSACTDTDGDQIHYRRWTHPDPLPQLDDVGLVIAFPPCTDLAASGARWWASKAATDPMFQHRAMLRALHAACYAKQCKAAWVVENPVGALSRLWRKPDAWINPCEFGGYLPADDTGLNGSPPRDGYTKRTGLWTGGGFRLPTPRPVPVADPTYVHHLGSRRAAERSVTPRGLAIAIAQANRPEDFR